MLYGFLMKSCVILFFFVYVCWIVDFEVLVVIKFRSIDSVNMFLWVEFVDLLLFILRLGNIYIYFYLFSFCLYDWMVVC